MTRGRFTSTFLHECFVYDPVTGVLRWKEHRPLAHFLNERTMLSSNARWGGKIAGTRHKARGRASNRFYIVVWVQKERHQAHRVIWSMVHGMDLNEVPEFLDHRDGFGDNNCLNNLRPATKSQNSSNKVKGTNNTSGFKGVYWHSRSNAYVAKIKQGSTVLYLGTFESAAEAHEAYKMAAAKLHGEFARFE